jgi:hypothetical protein
VLGLLLLLAASALFTSDEPVALQLNAPFNDLFDRARENDAYAVRGTLSYTDEGRLVTIDGVKISIRGNTSKRESECAFPKLKVEFPDHARPSSPLFAGAGSIKIGTHCGEATEDQLTPKFGRLANELSPLREAFVYRLLAVVGVPTLKARPATITYVYTDARTGTTPSQAQPVVRGAMLLEGTDDAVRRVGGRREIEESEFTTAREQFAAADTVRLALAEAMIGNFDWCLKMAPDDAYRCDARHPLWNVVAVDLPNGKTLPLIYDFDVSGIVSGRHPWFHDVFNEAFNRSITPLDIEVMAQVQRTRTLFARRDLDAARAEFIARKDDAYRALATARLDPAGETTARRYLDSFYRAIQSDPAFYGPVVVVENVKANASPEGAPMCGNLNTIPPGTPVSEPLQRAGTLVQVMVLDALWHWGPPVKCDEIRRNPVWIDATAISREFPPQ